MSAGKIVTRVYKFNPAVDTEPTYRTYEIPSDHPLTPQAILRYIYQNLDPSLAFRDYNCYLGVCACCLLRVNGKESRGCSVAVAPGETVLLEPSRVGPLVRDLVVAFG